MKFAQDALFHTQREEYKLAFTCEQCLHFDASTQLCSLSMPTDEHRSARYIPGSEELLCFCKEFEME